MLVIALIVLYVIDALRDYNVWKASTYDKYLYTRRWHTYAFFFHLIVASLICYLISGASIDSGILLITIGLTRYVVFNTALNLLREKPLYYLSKDSNFIDRIFKRFEIPVYIIVFLLTIAGWIWTSSSMDRAIAF